MIEGAREALQAGKRQRSSSCAEVCNGCRSLSGITVSHLRDKARELGRGVVLFELVAVAVLLLKEDIDRIVIEAELGEVQREELTPFRTVHQSLHHRVWNLIRLRHAESVKPLHSATS